MRPQPTILLAFTDEEDLSLLGTLIHRTFNCASQKVANAAALGASLNHQSPVRILLIDLLFLPFDDTLQLIRDLHSNHPDLVIIPAIPENRRDLLKQIIALDIFHFLNRPFEPEEITLTLRRATVGLFPDPAVQTVRLNEQSHSYQGIIGRSETMRRLFDLIAKVADDDSSTILIRGESGTGKELVAKAIHVKSRRSDRNFVPVNCAAIPDDLLESELFGYTKGAFTGAATNKPGRIQYADGGTLFLDEIGDMKASLQAKLLRVLQEKEFEPVGAFKAVPVDTRILAATHCDLEQMVREGRFREDLYYRLSVIPITIAPLKERREDIPLLIDAFIETYTVKRGKAPFTLSPLAISALMNYEWKGNVRELENLIQHMSVLYGGRQLDLGDLPEKFHDLADDLLSLQTAADQAIPTSRPVAAPAEMTIHHSAFNLEDGPIDFNAIIGELETELIVQAMRIAAGNKKEAARLLSLKRTTLLEKIKKKELGRLWDE
jgi:DNA-binding NtrC family response regulator